MPWLALIPSQPVAIALSNLTLFLVGSAGIVVLGRRQMSEGHVRLALALHALWPNLVFQAGLPEKELLLVALLPWVLHFWIGSFDVPGGSRRAFGAGVLLGACLLVQPGLLYLPIFLAVHGLAAGPGPWPLGRRLLVLAAGALLIVSPWTLRNALVLGEFVPVATNAGGVLYRANNPRASGGYTDRGEVDLSNLGEVEADREGKRLAKEWILGNPAAFLKLGFEKQLRFMGDDAVGAYHTLKRGKNQRDGTLYIVAKAVSNAFWLLVCGLILCSVTASMKSRTRMPPETLCLLLAFAYSLLLHSVGESAGKYHLLWSATLALLAASGLAGFQARQPRPGPIGA
jgi:hypothetical protein